MKYTSFFTSLFAAIVALTLPTLALASAAPTVTSFQVSPSSISNNYATVATWTISDDKGADMLINCPAGVTVKTDRNEAIVCGTRFPAGLGTADTQGLIFTNVGGTNKSISITLYPHDSNGNDYDSGSMNATVTVSTSPQPITAFDASSHSAVSGSSLTFTWTGVDAPGTNLQFTCTPNIQLYSSNPASGSPTALPCGTTAFPSMLGISSSQAIYAVSASAFVQTVTATIVPAIAAGSYDMTHGLSTTFVVTAIPPTPDPSVTNFAVSSPIAASGIAVTFTWAIANASSSNLEIDCPDGVSAYVVVGTSSTPITCNTLAFTDALGSTGTTTIGFTSADRFNAKQITAVIIPRNASGTYLRTIGRAVSIVFSPTLQTTVPITPTPIPVSLPTTTAASSTKKISHYTFTFPLKRGSHNADVTALQIYLSQDPTVYPEATVSGYYGPATATAVGRLQIKYKLVSKSDGALTTVGPKTRALLNTLQ